MIHLPLFVSWQQKYHPAMLTSTQEEADAYLEALVDHCLRSRARHGQTLSREDALRIERHNLGYWAGYYTHETRYRVERLYRCVHPLFGSIEENGPPDPEQVLRMGIEMGQQLRARASEGG